ncbi:hypothetical protein CANARDRAFT_5950 [[Candida] arabinofermentans NRRL YB-2248]|uniref:Uncharacterized protein n=1 Tax=[Candida] arabinofermentans NRRL YB-2248 TaxID=983967 RepID=A0A1E4T6N0_9ASCO|nr:hypothetical protein CANARDRAFT_5950 [[Candida] arabinofermentans NRRL YB-2248]
METSMPEADVRQIKHLLNRLMLGLNDEYTENANINNQLKELGKKSGLNYDQFLQKASSETDKIDNTSLDLSNIELSDEDLTIYKLEAQKNMILSKLQKEEYLCSNYETILDKHKELINLINLNIKNKMRFDQDYSVLYKNLVNERIDQYQINLDFLDNLVHKSSQDYNRMLKSLRSKFENYVTEDEKGEDDEVHAHSSQEQPKQN